jgi:hypothetical protein
MLRVLFAIAIAGLVFAGGSGTTQAAPILPLPAAATAGIDNMTDVQWGRRCWRDRWGRLRCVSGGWGPGWGGAWGPGWGAWGSSPGGWGWSGGPGWGGGWGATAGVTVGAVCVAGGDFQASDLEALRAANWTMSALKQKQTFRGAIASAK